MGDFLFWAGRTTADTIAHFLMQAISNILGVVLPTEIMHMDDKPRSTPDPDSTIWRSFDLDPQDKTNNPAPLPAPANRPPKPEPKPEESPRRTNRFVSALWVVTLLCFGPVLLLGIMWLHFTLTGVTSDKEVGGWAFLYLFPVFYVLPLLAWPGIAASVILIILDGNLWRRLLAACIAAAFSLGLIVSLSYIS